MSTRPRVLYVEPFHGGSHRRFGELLMRGVPAEWHPLTLPGHHWKWRMRGAAVHFALESADLLARDFDLVLASSFTDLAALSALAPRIAACPRVLYFHENQLSYPDREARARDHHFGLTQIVSGLVADRCVFNSAFNRDAFLAEGEALLARMPRPRPRGWMARIADEAEILPVPVALEAGAPPAPDPPPGAGRAEGPLLVWPHRWEHDKGPERLFAVLTALADRGVPFRVALLGERAARWPSLFERGREALGDRVVAFGPASRAAYLATLKRAQIALSTAEHEFFGVAMVEASHAGAFALVPDRLAYPEIFPAEHRYGSDDELEARLGTLCRDWTGGALDLRADRRALTARFGPPMLEAWRQAILRWSGAS
jgi:glycosyltransferase involved in cell wall biosynthesis